jgi:hypothetical protein
MSMVMVLEEGNRKRKFQNGTRCWADLVFSLAPSQEAGGDRRSEGGAPDPREAHVELAESGIQVDRDSHSISNWIGMSRRGEVCRKVVNAPRQDRPHAHDSQEENQGEDEKNVADRNHVRRAGRPGV